MHGIYITIAYALALLLAVGCQTEIAPRSAQTLPQTTQTASAQSIAQAGDEEDTINLKMTAHATQLVFAADDFKRQDLSEMHVREIKAWWDSLPQPLQSKVKNNTVAVEVVSNVVATPRTPALAQKSDNKIEQTGAALEKVIGTSTDMTYTVNTTVVEKVSTSAPSTSPSPNNDATATTNILLVETVPVKLSQFALDLPLHDMSEVSTETAQALQYWWTTLPEDLQNKIRQQEISIQLHICSIDRGVIGKYNQKPILGLNADTKIAIVEDILHRIIGTYRAGTRTIALAKISATTPSIEKLSSQNAHIRGDQYLRLQLRNNRTTNGAPSTM